MDGSIPIFRLTERGSNGLCCDWRGVGLGPVALMEAYGNNADISTILSIVLVSCLTVLDTCGACGGFAFWYKAGRFISRRDAHSETLPSGT
jgi:hypothetical protein